MEKDPSPRPSPRGRGSKNQPAHLTKRTQVARKLRRNQTPAEAKLWDVLRNRGLGVKFRRQYQVGPYYPDLVCIEQKLIIELDGGHHAEEDHSANDAERTRILNAAGYTVLRFWNNEVMTNLEGVTQTIQDALHQKALSHGERVG